MGREMMRSPTAAKVKVLPVDDPDPEDPIFSKTDRVRVTLADGTVLAGDPVSRAKGHAHNPLDLQELRAKFEDCVGSALPAGRRNALFEQLNDLPRLAAVSALYI